MLFNLDFANNTILPYLFFFFLIINLYFLIQAAIAQNFTPIAEYDFYKLYSNTKQRSNLNTSNNCRRYTKKMFNII